MSTHRSRRLAWRIRGPESINILLVDDIVASGNTLQQAIGFLRAKLPRAQILFWV
jgi:hypoxanthine phosphoribosyltransferase